MDIIVSGVLKSLYRFWKISWIFLDLQSFGKLICGNKNNISLNSFTQAHRQAKCKMHIFILQFHRLFDFHTIVISA